MSAPLLQAQIEGFVDRWAPKTCWMKRRDFINELRVLMEAFACAALAHQSLPDTEHKHGEPV